MIIFEHSIVVVDDEQIGGIMVIPDGNPERNVRIGSSQ